VAASVEHERHCAQQLNAPVGPPRRTQKHVGRVAPRDAEDARGKAKRRTVGLIEILVQRRRSRDGLREAR